MKKIFAFTLSVAMATCAWAGVSGTIAEPQRLSNTDNSTFGTERIESFYKVPTHESRAERTFDYSPAYDPYTGVYFNNQAKGDKFAQAFEFTSEMTSAFAGSKITSFNFYLGSNSMTNKNRILNYEIFLTKDLTEEPFYSQEYSTTSTTRYSQCKVELDQPYTIKEGEPVFIGMKYKLASAKDIHIIIDYSQHSDIEGGWVGYYNDSTQTYEWDNIANQYGFVCLGVTIVGEKMPENQAAADYVSCLPVVATDSPFDFSLIYHNTGVTPITEVELEYTIGNKAPVTVSRNYSTQNFGFNQFAQLNFTGVTYDVASSDDVEIKVEITKVNGVENVNKNPSASTTFICINKGTGYDKNAVIEEIGGAWCGYCPRGIVIMDSIAKVTDGSIIPVSVHTGDEMVHDSWANVAALSGGAAPYAIINRYLPAEVSTFEEVYGACKAVMLIPSIGKIAVQAESVEADHSINITTTSEFLFDFNDAANRYRIAFGITQDNVGPYNQTNYYSGSNEKCGGWENLPNPASTTYNDVALDLVTYSGIRNSVPNEVKAGTPYTFTYNYKLDPKVPFDDVHVVAYLLDIRKDFVENAATIRELAVAGVESITADDNANAPVEYFNLQGVRIENPANGIFIRRQGSAVSKVIIR